MGVSSSRDHSATKGVFPFEAALHKGTVTVKVVASQDGPLPQLNGFRRNSSFSKIIARHLSASVIVEHALPALGDLLVNLKQLFFEISGFLLSRATLHFQWDARALGQTPDGFDER